MEHAEELQAPVQKLADRIVTLLIFTSPAELGLATPLVMIAAVARAARNGILVKGGIHLELLAKADVFVFDKTGTPS